MFCLSYIIAWCIKSTFVLKISPRDYNENSLPRKTTKTTKRKFMTTSAGRLVGLNYSDLARNFSETKSGS